MFQVLHLFSRSRAIYFHLFGFWFFLFVFFKVFDGSLLLQGFGGGGPGTPHSAPSPGGSMGSSQDDPYQRDLGSPGHWGSGRPAVPPSPVGTPQPVSRRIRVL